MKREGYSEKVIEDVEEGARRFSERAVSVEFSYAEVLKRLFAGAGSFGLALMVELLHLKITGLVLVLATVAPLSGMELFLVALGVGMLLDAIRLSVHITTSLS